MRKRNDKNDKGAHQSRPLTWWPSTATESRSRFVAAGFSPPPTGLSESRGPAGSSIGCWCSARRCSELYRGVWVRAQRGIARRSIASQSGSRLSSQSSDLPAWIDLRELRSSRADEVSHLVQIRFGWHACWLRSERHRGGGHRYEVSVLLNWLLRSRFADAQRVRSSIFASLCAAGIEIC